MSLLRRTCWSRPLNGVVAQLAEIIIQYSCKLCSPGGNLLVGHRFIESEGWRVSADVLLRMGFVSSGNEGDGSNYPRMSSGRRVALRKQRMKKWMSEWRSLHPMDYAIPGHTRTVQFPFQFNRFCKNTNDNYLRRRVGGKGIYSCNGIFWIKWCRLLQCHGSRRTV